MDTNLTEAIREIQQTAVKAMEPKPILVECDDGKGGKLFVPAVLTPGEGIRSMLATVKDGSEFAELRRLRNAPGPDRRTGVAQHQALASFIGHANRFKSADSAVWANAAGRKLVSVLDYHPAGATSPARWGQHRGLYECPLSEAWLAWGGGDALEMEQDDFAALLDSRDRELTSGDLPSGKSAPDPTALITLASNLEVYSSATAKRERDPNTSRLRISYSEEKGVNGTVQPPPSFLVFIRVFQDGYPMKLEVRLRVTVEDGRAKFAVQIHAAADVLRSEFDNLCRQVESQTTLPVFVGTPE